MASGLSLILCFDTGFLFTQPPCLSFLVWKMELAAVIFCRIRHADTCTKDQVSLDLQDPFTFLRYSVSG